MSEQGVGRGEDVLVLRLGEGSTELGEEQVTAAWREEEDSESQRLRYLLQTAIADRRLTMIPAPSAPPLPLSPATETPSSSSSPKQVLVQRRTRREAA